MVVNTAKSVFNIQNRIFFKFTNRVISLLECNKHNELFQEYMTPYIDAINDLEDSQIIELFELICRNDRLGAEDGIKLADPEDIGGYAQYSLKLLVDARPELLSKRYKKLIMEYKFATKL